MNPEPRLDRMISNAANVAYVVLVGAMVLALFPQSRRALRSAWGAMVWRYQLGTYLMNRRPTPAWVKTAQDTPAEELPGEGL